MNLGVIYKNGRIVSHRSLLKVLLNPILRRFGFQIATLYFSEINKLGTIILTKCNKTKNFKFSFDYKVDNNEIRYCRRRLI